MAVGCVYVFPSAGVVWSEGLTVSGCGSGLICVGASARSGLGQGGFGEVSLCFWSWLVRRLCGLWVWAVVSVFPRQASAGWCVRAGRWPVASLGVPQGGVVDGRAGGVRSVQVGQQRAHVQGVGVPDENLTEDRGVGGKQYAMPGRGGGEEREDVRGPRRGGEHDVGRVRPRERCRGERDHRTAVYCEVPSCAMVEEPD